MKGKFSRFEMIFTPAALAVLCAVSLVFHAGLLVVLCTVLGVIGSVLNGAGRKYCYFFSLASSLMYAFISLSNRYYGEAILHFAFVSPLFLYSILRWFRPREAEAHPDVFHLSRRALLGFGLVLVFGTAGYGFVLSLLSSRLPYLNAVSTVLAVGANFLSARRMKEQWYLQLASNAALIALWCIAAGSDAGNLPVLVQNFLFIICNVRGLLLWHRMSSAQPASPASGRTPE